MEMFEEEGREMARQVSKMLNNFSNGPTKGFIEEMSREHRTLQQSFTRLCVAWLEFLNTCAKDGRYDGRNQASVEFAEQIFRNVDERYTILPFI